MYTHQTNAHTHEKKIGARPACRPSSVVRNRYFYSMLLEAEDMAVDQAFHLGNIRRHDAELHGYGTVCGLRVLESECDEVVLVRAGVAVDCLGREIRVEREVRIDLHEVIEEAVKRRREHREKEGARRRRPEVEARREPDDRDGDDDEECDDDPIDLYVSVCYGEYDERPLQSIGGPESCCASTCEMSRTRHCFRIVVSHEPPEPPPKRIRELVDCFLECKPEHIEEFICEWITEECWDCVPDPCDEAPCVPLARVTVVPNGRVRDIDNCCIRPLVVPTTLLTKLLGYALDHARRTR